MCTGLCVDVHACVCVCVYVCLLCGALQGFGCCVLLDEANGKLRSG